MAKYRIREIIRSIEDGISELKENKHKAETNLNKIKELKNNLKKERELYAQVMIHKLIATIDITNYSAYATFFESVLKQNKYITEPLANYDRKINNSYKVMRDTKMTMIEQNEINKKSIIDVKNYHTQLNEIKLSQNSTEKELAQLSLKIGTTRDELNLSHNTYYDIKSLAKKLNITLNQENITNIKKDSLKFKFKKTLSFASSRYKEEIKLHHYLITYDKLGESYYKDLIHETMIDEKLSQLHQEEDAIKNQQKKLNQESSQLQNLINKSKESQRNALTLIEKLQSAQDIAKNFIASNKDEFLLKSFINNFLEQGQKNPATLFELDNQIRQNNFSNLIIYQVIEKDLQKAILSSEYIENLNQFKDSLVFEQELTKTSKFNESVITQLDKILTKLDKPLRKLKKVSDKSQSIRFDLDNIKNGIAQSAQGIKILLNKNANHIQLNQNFQQNYFHRNQLNNDYNNDIFLNNYLTYMLINSENRQETSQFMGIKSESFNNIDFNSFDKVNFDFNNQLNDMCKIDYLTELMGLKESFVCFDDINKVMSQQDIGSFDNSFDFSTVLDDTSLSSLSNISLDNITISDSSLSDLSNSSFDFGSTISNDSWTSSLDSVSSSSSWDSSSSSSWDSSSSFDSGSSSSW